MSKGGIVVRLIDIVLNLLFGFMCISTMERKSPVKLPQSDLPVQSQIQKEQLLVISINQQEQFLLESENMILPNFDAVKNLILTRNESFKKLDRTMKVRIRSYWNLPIRYTMRIANFCRDENIPVGMDVESVSSSNR
ncbi:MAG: biopolymer transporter ExbD [candidate division KSB1 bacterium]|nr:biopolymer transporter ExbD [candidate division KSB1 bacterium]MDZ7336237.1 biopolymer transporter ExbD [candidate division KSB1 bacterium]MDZ7357272.1 biopolymer transporter ExbD [candidate division KSB1 bacterium]MDZ7375976.1 biopolymer transporter ExbD [candidate division KSB1 bacterium]MDZ7402100.1 biopolymer transporter ExbD [candidate division KSB1 bacterium]